ncbi:pantoate--beta-alanine ligase [Hoyosella sp. G463]|uniref:Pantothenate synthetase n=1 Tax=Lolliginicoccus lacisalsi TaxID=2742202 RepID=A0A927JDE6_9ACTN|nr:pantoate--beta-alanine ligase [Lolliginicoccus lacisalsi]MBD8507294.1 pantoate--beta-alanine ligase [Lolliginicoccus lacisalsi]
MSGNTALFAPGELRVHQDPATVARISSALRRTGRQVVLVPTMGALHAGHIELVKLARRTPNSVVIVSIFVNPLQFGEGEDLDKYPRTLDADVELLREAGVEVVFAPSAREMYPQGRRTMVHPGPMGDCLEGASRPGHFAGMLTVVAKLLLITRPHAAFFGEKDYQQLALIRQMAADLDLGTRIVGVPTVREADGLAMSSRNRYLTEEQRRDATVLSAALVAGAHAGDQGPEAVLATAQAVLAHAPSIKLDYLELRGPDLEPLEPEGGEARLLIAARVGETRLIDNVGLVVAPGPRTGSPEPQSDHH